jgi:hypothetical protein
LKPGLILIGIAAVAMLPLTAIAATPNLSGTYALSFEDVCQITLSATVDPSTHDLNALETINDGKVSQTVAVATFNSTTRTLSLSGMQVKGSLLLVPGLSNPTEQMSESSVSESGSYSVPNNTTLVLIGETFHAAFGNVVSGVARYATFVAQDPSKPECYHYGTAIHQ